MGTQSQNGAKNLRPDRENDVDDLVPYRSRGKPSIKELRINNFAQKEDLDTLLVPCGFLIIIVYNIIVSCRDSNDPHSTGRDWVKRTMQGDNKDTSLAVFSSSLTAAYSLCGACLMIFPIAWLANSSSYVFQSELVYGNTSPLLITFKFGSLIACFLQAMACFAQSAEHFTEAYCLMNSQSSNIAAGDVEAATRAVRGGSHFKSLGMRCLQYAGILLLWFFGPIPMFVSSVALVIFLHYNYTGQYHVRNRVDWQIQSFQKLRLCEAEILCGLREDNVIGRGPSGKVYKVVLSNDKVIAVKKPWSGRVNQCENDDVEKGMVQDDGFIARFDTLGRITHKNIMKLWYCCTTRDCQQLLVYDYMPNGSLGDFLHNKKAGLLNWPTRFKIALGAAEGISYLHHDCSPSIVHRNVKSNNILLDVDFGPRVVGTTNGVDASGKGPVIAGACGYIAPEFSHAHGLNRESDIYSFGVVMLELVTGKLPVNPELGEKDLVKWVRSTLDQKGVDHVLDPKLDSCYKEEVCKVLKIGLRCTYSCPVDRPSMRRVVELLEEVGRGASP